MKITISLVLSLFCSLTVIAQNKKALKYFNEARGFYREGELIMALEKLDKAISKDDKFPDPALMAGQISIDLERYDQAIVYFDKAWEAGEKGYVAFQAGMSTYKIGYYEKAKVYLNRYLESGSNKMAYIKASEKAIKDCDFAIDAIANPTDYKPINLGPNVNTPAMEYFPSISADGQTLVFTYRDPEGKRKDENFFNTVKVNGDWAPARPLVGQLNTPFNEGAQCVTADGRQLIFVGCNRQEGKGSCDLYTAWRQDDGSWSKAENMGDSLNTANWETQPTISPDGKTLYFIRAKKREPEKSDIYYSTRRADGNWTKARKMPDPINSDGREASPFIHFDNQTFYFCSNGRVGMGSMDFYVSRRQEDGSWSEPENLGYPINSQREELGMVIASDGRTAYFSSDMPGGIGSLDLYQFDIPAEFRAITSAWIQGRIRDKVTGKPIENAQLIFTDLESGKEIHTIESNKQGRYFAVLPANSDYALSVQQEGYLFHSENFALKNEGRETAFKLDVDLSPLESGSVITLKNVFFNSDSYELRSESYPELNSIVTLLTENQELKISLDGHTDNEGDPGYNQKLSEDRAKAVRDYLIQEGIDASRLQYKGYGESQPIADNANPDGRQQNRRTELRIL